MPISINIDANLMGRWDFMRDDLDVKLKHVKPCAKCEYKKECKNVERQSVPVRFNPENGGWEYIRVLENGGGT